MAVIVWELDWQLPVQSVPITFKVMSSNHVHGKVYSIQQYVIKFVSDLRQDWFSLVSSICSTNKTDRHWNTVESGIKYHNLFPLKPLDKYL